MSLASQVLRLDGQHEQPAEEGLKQHQPSVDAKDGSPVWHSLAALLNRMPRTLIRMWIWMSLARPVMWLDGQPEDGGHEKHNPSVDAKGEVPDDGAQCPTSDHEEGCGYGCHWPARC